MRLDQQQLELAPETFLMTEASTLDRVAGSRSRRTDDVRQRSDCRNHQPQSLVMMQRAYCHTSSGCDLTDSHSPFTIVSRHTGSLGPHAV